MLWNQTRKTNVIFYYVFIYLFLPLDKVGTSLRTGSPGPPVSSRPGGWAPHRETLSFSGSLNATRRLPVSFRTAGGALRDTIKDQIKSRVEAAEQEAAVADDDCTPSFYLQDFVVNRISCVFLNWRLHFGALVWQHVEFHIPSQRNTYRTLYFWWRKTQDWVRIYSKLSSRVTLLLLAVPVSKISAGADFDLQGGGVGVVGHSQLQLSSHRDGVEETTVGADAADAALTEQKYRLQLIFLRHRGRKTSRKKVFLNSGRRKHT